ncbi:MAG: phage tail protein I, partial [Gemmatimonadaceae bacterium]
RWSHALGDSARPTAVAAADGGAIYVADAAGGRLLVFGADGGFRGSAPDGGDTAGLALDCAGRLILNPGGEGGAVRRALGLPAYAECGTFLAGPFTAPDAPARWQRVELETGALPSGTHLRLFTLTSDTLDGTGTHRPVPPATCGAPPDPSVVESDVMTAAPLDRWRAAPQDAPGLLAANVPARFLWIAGVLQGDGSATPTIAQIRLTHDEDGWMRYLPGLYRRDDGGRVFLERMLGAFESVLDVSDAELDDLPLAFDANAAPDATPHPTWLEWLAGWVDAELREAWPEARRRAVVAGAFGAHARRGTIERLRELVTLHAGATPFITELGATGIWSLGVTASLGMDTALAEASAQGAVLATTAVVDHAVLTDGGDFGGPAFAGAAHRFAVRVYEADLEGADGLERVRGVLDREKPAHTTYHLCPIGPRARVGMQALVGIDTIVGGPPAPAPLGGGAEGGALLGLAGEPPDARPGAVIGQGARVGATIS